MNVGLDVGNSGVKTVTKGWRDSFAADIGEGYDLRLEHKWAPGDMNVVWRGKRYFVGNVAKLQSDGAGRIRTESKAHNDTLLLALCALHRAVPDGSRVRVVTGVPIAQHNETQKHLMRGLLLGAHTICINGVTKEIHINSVDAVPETASAYFVVERSEKTYIVDCGSRTTGYSFIWKNNFINPQSGSLPYGVENFTGSRSAFVKAVVSELSQRWPLDAPIWLIGGAADILHPMFLEWFPNVRAMSDAIWCNAHAYYLLGERKYAKATV